MVDKPSKAKPTRPPVLTPADVAAYQDECTAVDAYLDAHVASVEDIERELAAFDAEQDKLWAKHRVDSKRTR